jgi:hypothetical protein
MMISKIISANGARAIAVCQDDRERLDYTLEIISVRVEGQPRADWICAHRFNSVENALKAAQEWLSGQV